MSKHFLLDVREKGLGTSEKGALLCLYWWHSSSTLVFSHNCESVLFRFPFPLLEDMCRTILRTTT